MRADGVDPNYRCQPRRRDQLREIGGFRGRTRQLWQSCESECRVLRGAPPQQVLLRVLRDDTDSWAVDH